jgi:cytochrome b6-f complex iron-sulfur subunit
MKRREAIQRLLIGTGTLIAVPAGILSSCTENPGSNLTSDLVIDLNQAANSALKSKGGFILDSGVIVINTDGNNWVALSSTCTHQACTVTYNSSQMVLPCPCHGSVFNLSGGVLRGPASRPLRTYAVAQKDNILTVSNG